LITYQNLWTNFLRIMENNYFTTYKFENYDVEGLKLEINFANVEFLEIKTHEEIDTPIENIEETFDPLLFGIDENLENIRNIHDLNGKKIILLDGHHRYEYLKRKDIDKSIEIVLISTVDVEILSYPSRLKIGKKEFEKILENNNFLNNVSSKFFVSIDDVKFFNKEIEDIYQLYEFKNFCYVNEYISSTVDENQAGEKDMVNFTPIKISEILDSDSLFPPKSTWITPRL